MKIYSLLVTVLMCTGCFAQISIPNYSVFRDIGFYADLGISDGRDYSNVLQSYAQSIGGTSVSGFTGFIEIDFGAQFKTINCFYLLPRLMFEYSNVTTNLSIDGTSVGSSESANILFLPGIDVRCYLIENRSGGFYIGGSVGYNFFYSDFDDFGVTANSPQYGFFAGLQIKLFEGGPSGIEIGYNFIPVTVSNTTASYGTLITTSNENFGGIFFKLSQYFPVGNYK
jgi:hypothetical protein